MGNRHIICAFTEKNPTLSLVQCSAIDVLILLNNSTFEFVFQKWSLIRQWSMHISRGDIPNMYAHDCSLPPCLYASIPSAPWAQNFSEFTMHGSSVRLRASVGKHIRSITKGLRGHAFHLNQLALNTESTGVLRNMNDQGSLSYLFLFVLSLFNSQLLTLKVMT